MRLYDMLCAEQARPCFGDDPVHLDGGFYECVVFDMQQVADYFYNLKEGFDGDKASHIVPAYTDDDGTVRVFANDFFGFKWEDLGCLIPPYEEMFCEYQAPDHMKMHNDKKGDIPMGKVGAWMSRMDIDTLVSDEAGQKLVKVLARHGVPTDQMGFFVDVQAFFDKPGNGGLMGPAVAWGIPLDEQGQLFLDEQGQPRLVWKPPVSLYSYDDELVVHFAQVLGGAIIVPALMGISILHTPQEESWHERKREEPHPRLSRKWAQRNGRALVSYYVLTIGGVKQRMVEGGHKTIGEVLRALHKVRGHRRFYKRSYFGKTIHPKNGRQISEENPYVVFIPEFERGSVKAGKVDKDYEVGVGDVST